MKYSLLLFAFICLFSSFSSWAQSKTYTTVNSAEKVYFTTKSLDLTYFHKQFRNAIEQQPFYYLLAYRIDSNKINGTDTTLYFNKILRDYTLVDAQIKGATPKTLVKSSCKSLSTFGPSVTKRADSFEVYQNGALHNIYYKTNAQVGDQWTFYSDDTLGTYYAELSFKELDTFLNIVDSIFNIKVVHNQKIEHAIDSANIIVSKNYGFLKTIDHYQFPFADTTVQLVGTDYPRRGVVQPHAVDIFDYEIGDEFHYYEFWETLPFITPGYISYQAHVIKKVISKEENDSSIVYHIHTTTCKSDSVHGIIDTLTITRFESNILPLEHGNIHTLYEFPKVDMEYNLHYSFFENKPLDTFPCFYLGSEDDIKKYSYLVGIGLFTKDSLIYSYKNSLAYLKYYKKSKPSYEGMPLEWGSPLEQEPCNIATNNISLNEIEVTPNPTDDLLYISSTKPILSLTLYDLQGRVVISKTTKELNPQMSLVDLRSGMYILHISDNSTTMSIKVMKH